MREPDWIGVLEKGTHVYVAEARVVDLVQLSSVAILLLQLCKEHGINKDGILEDFATQVGATQ